MPIEAQIAWDICQRLPAIYGGLNNNITSLDYSFLDDIMNWYNIQERDKAMYFELILTCGHAIISEIIKEQNSRAKAENAMRKK